MLKRILQLLSDSLIYGVSGFLGQLIGFLLLPLYTRCLQPADYGIMAMLAFIPSIFGTLSASGLKSAIFQQFFRNEDPDRRRSVSSTAVAALFVSASFILIVATGCAGSISSWLLGDSSRADLVRLSLLTAFVITITEVPLVGFQAARRAKTVGLLNVCQVVATVSATIYFVLVQQLGVRGVVLGSLVGSFVFAALCFVSARRNFSRRIDFKIWREMTAYSLPYLPHRLQAAVMVFWGDYMIRTQLGLDDLGMYSVATRIVVPIGFLSGAIHQAWNPYKFKVFAEEQNPGAFFRSTLTYFVFMLAYLWVGVSAWGPEVVRLMTAPVYHAAAQLIWVVALMRTVQAFYPMMATGLELSDNTRAVPLTSLASLAAVVVSSLVLVPLLGAYGAALSTTIAWLTLAIGYFLIAQQQIRVDYDWSAVAKIVASAAGLVAAISYVQTAGAGIRIGLATIGTVVFPLLGLFILHQSPSERSRIATLKSILIKRVRPTPVA